MAQHIDAVTGQVFETEQEYLDFVNPVTGHKATEIEHFDALTGGRASRIAAKAIARGEAKKEA